MISTFKAQDSYTSFKLSENIPYMETLNQNIPLRQNRDVGAFRALLRGWCSTLVEGLGETSRL
jgi:hypothetical protein